MSAPSTPPWRSWTPGLRVVVRRVLDDVPPDAPPPHYTDVVGELLAVDDGGVLVRTRRHGDVHVPADAIRLAKVVPPARPRRPAP